MSLRTSILAVILLTLAWSCNGDGPSGTEPRPLDLRGTWFAFASIMLFPEPPTGPRFCEDGQWTGILEINTQNEGSFTGTVNLDFEASSAECAQEFTLQETITGSITANGDITLVIGNLERMRGLIEAVTRCSAIPPVEEFSGFVFETRDGTVVRRDFFSFSSTEVQCLPEDEDTDRVRVAGLGFSASDWLPPDSARLATEVDAH